MKILLFLGCVVCFISIIKSAMSIIDDIDTNKARRKIRKILEGEKENDEKGRNE